MVAMSYSTSLHAQQGIASEPFPLSDGKSLTLVTTESWDGKSTRTGLDFILTEASKTPQTIYQLEVANSPFDLKLMTHDGLFPSFLSVVEKDDQLAILLGVKVGAFVESCHYLLFHKAAGSFQKVNSLEIECLLASRTTMNFRELVQLKLSNSRQLHIQHHDHFEVNIDIKPDNSATINGKPCAPNNAPIKRMRYDHFLHALSPQTARTYGVKLQTPKAIPWWTDTTLSPPFSLDAYLEMSGIIEWISPPALDPASILAAPKR